MGPGDGRPRHNRRRGRARQREARTLGTDVPGSAPKKKKRRDKTREATQRRRAASNHTNQRNATQHNARPPPPVCTLPHMSVLCIRNAQTTTCLLLLNPLPTCCISGKAIPHEFQAELVALHPQARKSPQPAMVRGVDVCTCLRPGPQHAPHFPTPSEGAHALEPRSAELPCALLFPGQTQGTEEGQRWATRGTTGRPVNPTPGDPFWRHLDIPSWARLGSWWLSIGAPLFGTVWHFLALFSTRWHVGTLWYSLALFGTVWHCLAPFGTL